jgi:hypothetical protein
MSDEMESLKERLREQQARVDELWPKRLDDPEAFSAALDELNETILALNRLWAALNR